MQTFLISVEFKNFRLLKLSLFAGLRITVLYFEVWVYDGYVYTYIMEVYTYMV